MATGYLKLYRSLTDSPIWELSPAVLKLWVYCLSKAAWKDYEQNGQKIRKGEFISTYREISQKCFLAINTVRSSLKLLESKNNVKISSQQRSRKGTRIFLPKFGMYQKSVSTSDTVPTPTVSTIDTPLYQPVIQSLVRARKSIKKNTTTLQKAPPSATDSSPKKPPKPPLPHVQIIDAFHSLKGFPPPTPPDYSRNSRKALELLKMAANNLPQALKALQEIGDHLNGKNLNSWLLEAVCNNYHTWQKNQEGTNYVEKNYGKLNLKQQAENYIIKTYGKHNLEQNPLSKPPPEW